MTQDWPADKRLQLICRKSFEIMRFVTSHHADPILFHLADTIRLMASMSDIFLTANAKSLLEPVMPTISEDLPVAVPYNDYRRMRLGHSDILPDTPVFSADPNGHALICPRCGTSLAPIPHGETAQCHHCHLFMQRAGNCLTIDSKPFPAPKSPSTTTLPCDTDQ